MDPRLIPADGTPMLSLPMLWLKKLDCMETAKIEMEPMKALDASDDLEAKIAAQKQLATSTGDAEQAWTAEV